MSFGWIAVWDLLQNNYTGTLQVRVTVHH